MGTSKGGIHLLLALYTYKKNVDRYLVPNEVCVYYYSIKT